MPLTCCLLLMHRNVMIDPVKLEENIRNMVLRYGSRLFKLHVLQAEIKVNVRWVSYRKQTTLCNIF